MLFQALEERYVFKSPLKRLMAATADAFGRLLLALPCGEWPASTPLRILVIRLDHIGDIVCALPFLKELRRRYPKAHITFLTSASGRELLRDNPDVNDVFVYDAPWFARQPRRVEWPWRALRDLADILRRRFYDLSIDLRGDVRHHLLTSWAGIPLRLGYGQTGGGFLLHRQARWNRQAHAIDHNLGLLSVLDPHEQSSGEFSRSPTLAWKARAEEEQWVKSITDGMPFKIFHVDAGTAAKRWPIERFVQLVNQSRSKQEKSVLVGSDPALSRAFESAVRDPHLINVIGRTTLAQLVCLLQKATVVVSADSGPAHIAAALGRKTIVLWSGTVAPDQWKPVGAAVQILHQLVPCAPCGLVQCNQRQHFCMEALTLDQLSAALQTSTGTDLSAA